jgi:hypothetical protein
MAVYREITCIRCGEMATRCTTAPSFCLDCGHEHAREGRKANNCINSAVAKGLLPRARTLLCVDCGSQATEYEHRDYLEPMKVEPVCHSCNLKRGPALDSRLRSITAA